MIQNSKAEYPSDRHPHQSVYDLSNDWCRISDDRCSLVAHRPFPLVCRPRHECRHYVMTSSSHFLRELMALCGRVWRWWHQPPYVTDSCQAAIVWLPYFPSLAIATYFFSNSFFPYFPTGHRYLFFQQFIFFTSVISSSQTRRFSRHIQRTSHEVVKCDDDRNRYTE